MHKRGCSLANRTAAILAAIFTAICIAKADLPTGWTDNNIGSPTWSGIGIETNGLWDVSGGGADINNAGDQFNFVSQGFMTDGAIVAQVLTLQNTDPSTGLSKAGVMLRNDGSPGAINLCVVATAGQGVAFQVRSSTGEGTSISQVSGVTVPVWVELVRSSDIFSGFYSKDGTNWTPIGSPQTILMNGSLLAGLAVTAHNNNAVNGATFTNVSVTPPTFGVYRQYWANLQSSLGNTLTELTNTAYNPNWPNSPTAGWTHIFTNFETEINSGINNYGQRLRTMVVPPMSGNYTFWIASDDTSELFLSTNESPSGMRPIATNTSWTPSEDWTEYSYLQSPQVTLQAGFRYYMEMDMQQGQGGDDCSVRWQLPNGVFEQPMQAVSPAGTMLIPYNGIDSPPGIYSQTTNASVVEGYDTSVSLLVTNTSGVSYQWLLDGAPINDTNSAGPVYPINNPSVSANNGEVYTCVVSNAAGAVTSAPITLTVLPDTTPPVVVHIANSGASNVVVAFSKPLSIETATNTANYLITNGLAVISAALGSDNVTVTLTTAPLTYGSNYWLVINGVEDLSSIPNTIATNTTVSFVAELYFPEDIGSPTLTSTSAYTANGIAITAGGSGVAGSFDQFNFQSLPQTGDFDVSICLSDLADSSPWAQAGIMARATLTPGSQFAAVFATPSINGCNFSDRYMNNAGVTKFGQFPANYPNTFLRLKRASNVFTGFASYDGITWTQLGAALVNMTDPIYLGIAVSSDSTNQATTAQFLNMTNVSSNAVIGTVGNPHEPLGPSSRTSPIAISEIMYKPAPRSDGNNTEFLELYNSNPWFQDISGYQVVCADMNYTIPAGTIMPGGGFLVLAASPQGMFNVYGITNVLGPYTGSLKKSETLELFDEQTNLLLTVPYSATYPWPVAADGTGHSIVLAYPSYGEGDPRAWSISDVVGGSPGQVEAFRPSPLRSVAINEILAHSENFSIPPFVELYNHSTNAVDLSGCILTDDFATNQFVIPSGTQVPAGGFVSFESAAGFNLNPAGDTIYFIMPDRSRVLDAVQFEGQADGVSYGRWPDGANDFYPFQARTPGTNNSAILIGNIVINELMYDPISKNDDDQYIELYNQGSNTVSLANWQFTSGVKYTFPAGATIGPNGYVVIGKNAANLMAKYTNLNTGNTWGNYSGKLSHNGERVALSMPQSLFGTNTIYVVEDDVTYGTGGRWGRWASGGGSSLELKDPHANHHLAANWTDSDETAKSQWVDIENTGVLDNGQNYDATIDYCQMGLLDVGECLVDNIEVDWNGINYVSNSNFESGLTSWSLQGAMVRSALENSGYGGSLHSMHIRCTDRIWTGVNSCEGALRANSMGGGDTVTLRYKARWLHGWPEPLLRLNGNWLEATGTMPIPPNLGTPGAPNSAYVTNAGPAIYQVAHNPPIPPANQPVTVTARVHDPDGLAGLTLSYRIDPSTSYTAVPMRDNGAGGDSIAGDGIFSAQIPAHAANTIAAFYISATDSLGATTRFPALSTDPVPVPECVVMFGDGNPVSTFGVYHCWITQTNATRWANLSDLSNDGNDFTFVCNGRIIYNAQGHFAGSPYHQDFDTPTGSLCHYKWVFPADDVFLGATDFNKIHQPGNGAGDDGSLQREQIANTFLRALGVPWLNRRFVAVYFNGNRRGGTLMEDAQVPDGDLVKEHFPNDTDGWLYKMQPWFEMAPAPSGSSIGFNNNAWCNLMPYTTTGGVLKTARYRYNFEVRRTPGSDNDFTNVFSLVDAANSYGSANYVAAMENLANMENWMRVFAANHAAGNWDSYGCQNAQNLYGYMGTLGTKYTLMMWDYNIVLGNSGSWGPGQALFDVNGEDPNTQNIYNCPTFLRMYWRALQELVNGPLNPAVSGPLANAKYNAFVANGLNVENPNTAILPWLGQAQTSIASQLAAVNAASFAVTSMKVTNNAVAISGVAPVNVDQIWFNGESWPVTWTSLTGWTITVPLGPQTNSFVVTAADVRGQAISGSTTNVTAVYNGQSPSPVSHIVINEIMYNPLIPGAQYAELHNNLANATFDLSGWEFQGLNYTFPRGTSIGPGGFLVLAADGAAFAAAYGATVPVFDTFGTGVLATNGTTTLALVSDNITMNEVRFSSQPPWPAGANGLGSSLQLIDDHQDNWRAGNWASPYPPATTTPSGKNSVATTLPAFPPLWINEIQPDNFTGITNSAGQTAPWLELYNPTSNAVSLAGLYLANNYANLTNWEFPSGASINAGQFEIVFLDGQTNLSTLYELHAGFTAPPATGSVALSRLYNGQPQVLDYLDYTNLPANYSYGSLPDGQSFNRQAFFYATPGETNNGTASYAVGYDAAGSVYAQNFDSLPNPGAVTVNTANPVTIGGVTYDLENPLNFAAPVSSATPGGLGLLSTMAGWYGSAAVEMKAGASAGDQSTGGIISFGATNSSATNRALGLLATSTTGAMAFGVKLINQTPQTFSSISLAFTGELWRQQPNAKELAVSYLIDRTAALPLPTNGTTALPALNVSFPTGAFTPLDGTQPQNQLYLAVTNQAIADWPPGAALWLVWQMASAAGTSQGLAIDNLAFSAGDITPPLLAIMQTNGTVVISWPASAAGYTLEYNSVDISQAAAWQPVSLPVTAVNGQSVVSVPIAQQFQFFRLIQ